VDTSEACGGRDRLSVYTSTGSVTTYPIPTVLTTDLPGNWKYSRCLAYVYFAFRSLCNPEGWFLTQIQGAWRRSGFSVSGHIPTQQLGPKLSYTMLNLRLSRGGHGSWR
jgi:hypothetical protein